MSNCPKCDRSFLLLAPYVQHVHEVHDVARKVAKIVVDGVATVPFVETRRGTGGACGDCPKDPALLPGHPNCTCEPDGGWDDYLATTRDKVPTNWTETEWHAHVDMLRNEKVT